jgi:DNA helicase II / ATP-dependent DNA helicase PcrA
MSARNNAPRYSASEIFKVIKDFELAPEKIQAIENAPLDSPSLVVAGAGSGKTELLAVRVLWLVANGYARPEQILGLTFTKKAATELSKRIFEALIKLRESAFWPEDLEFEFVSPTISTYNAFSNQIFRDNSLALGYESESTLLSEASAFQLAREVCVRYGSSVSGSLSDLELNLDNLVQKVLELSQAMSDNGASAESVRELVEQTADRIGSLPKKEGQEVESRFGYIDDMVQALRPTPLIAELAEWFQKEKKKRSFVDYSDQVSLAYKAVTEIDQAGQRVRENFTQVLLDEYQDTSVLQTKLLSTLFARASVFAVGDPNQSIYGWRGASSANLDQFAVDFGSAKHFSLQTSWRNPTRVLELANRISEPLAQAPSYERQQDAFERVLPVKLVAKQDAVSGTTDFVFEQTIEKEAEKVASWLKPAVSSGLSCAVLMRKRSSMALFVEKLQQQGIEVEVVGLGGLLELPEIVDLVSALKVVQRSDAGSELIRLLTGARWRIGVKDIDRLFVIAKKLSGPRQEGVFREELTIVEALDVVLNQKLELLKEFSDASLSRLQEAARLFQNLRSATALPLTDFVRVCAEELWLDIELRANPKLQNPLAQLQSFYEIVAGFGVGSAGLLLGQFLNWLDYAAKKERFEIPKVTPSQGVVQVLTVHAAKGLEWDYVAIPNLVEDDFPSKPRSVSGWLTGAELPFPLRGDAGALPVFSLTEAKIQGDAKEAVENFKSDNKEHQLREELRLIYVAITRSKQALLCSGSYWKPANSGSRKPSRFITELAKGVFDFPDLESAENPLDLLPRSKSWPLEPIGETHRTMVVEASARVEEATKKLPSISESDLASSKLHEEIDLLLREQDDRIRALSEVTLPVRIPASKFKEFVSDLPGQAANYLRPVPSRPYRATKTGTAFHSWVEDFLIAEVDNPSDEIADLSEVFKNSRFKDLEQADIEVEINLTRGLNTFVCKLDAVFKVGERFEIVDWKTGAAPKTKSDQESMALQLALYRFAYSELRSIPIEMIDVSFYFVADDKELVPEKVPGPAELIEIWEKLFS